LFITLFVFLGQPTLKLQWPWLKNRLSQWTFRLFCNRKESAENQIWGRKDRGNTPEAERKSRLILEAGFQGISVECWVLGVGLLFIQTQHLAPKTS